MRKKTTTEDFIVKSISKHGYKYNYDKTNYTDSITKVIIICPAHGDFFQRPVDHARGRGCPKCSGKYKKSTEEFILECRAIHGDKYDYSKAEYIDNKTKVNIACYFHGVFYQAPTSHIHQNQGCPKCKGKNKTTSEWVSEAINVHGNKYDYSKSVYVNSKTKITITCPIHGDFKQNPNNHVRLSHSCPSCSGRGKSSTLRFTKKAKEIHGNRFDYSKVSYTTSHIKVPIICKNHGIFYQTPSQHLSGSGCKKCSGVCKPTTAEFIKKASSIHNSKYTYSKSKYKNKESKITITCPVHGDFKQSPHNHINGHGCSGCAEYGYSADRVGFVYVLMSKDRNLVKIGITNNIDNRIKSLYRSTPFDFRLISHYELKGEDALEIESKFHKLMTSANLRGFNGATEWFESDPVFLDMIREECTSLG